MDKYWSNNQAWILAPQITSFTTDIQNVRLCQFEFVICWPGLVSCLERQVDLIRNCEAAVTFQLSRDCPMKYTNVERIAEQWMAFKVILFDF